MIKRLSLLLFCLLICSNAAAALISGNVSWIYDGDTIKVDGVGKVRLIGIDSPERKDSPRDAYYLRHDNIAPDKLRQVGQMALKFNIEQVKSRRVRLEFDHEKTDSYGRTLAYVFLPDGRLLNHLLLKNGLAAVYRRFNFKRKDDFLKAEKFARDQRLGLWNN